MAHRSDSGGVGWGGAQANATLHCRLPGTFCVRQSSLGTSPSQDETLLCCCPALLLTRQLRTLSLHRSLFRSRPEPPQDPALRFTKRLSPSRSRRLQSRGPAPEVGSGAQSNGDRLQCGSSGSSLKSCISAFSPPTPRRRDVIPVKMSPCTVTMAAAWPRVRRIRLPFPWETALLAGNFNPRHCETLKTNNCKVTR